MPNNMKDKPAAVGIRVKSARMLSGYDRLSFATITNISMATLRSWEEPTQGRSGLSIKGANRLTQALKLHGVYCTTEWLFSGKGPGPNLINVQTKSSKTADITWGEDEAILKDVNSFITNNKNAVISFVIDDAMLPLFSYGDYVGGTEVYGDDIISLIGQNCIIKTENKTLIRTIHSVENNIFTLNPLNKNAKVKSHLSTEIEAAAEIIWHRWRKKI